MDTKNNRFNRFLLVILIFLYLITLGVFSYRNWVGDPAYWNLGRTLANALVLSIPLVLLYGGLYVLASAWRQFTLSGQVGPGLAKVVRRAPRAGAVLIIFFISLFSLDVFEVDAPPLEVLGGFLVHNIPTIILIVLLITAWKRPVVGFAAFLLAAVLFAAFFVRLDSLPNLLLFVFPLLLVALLFYGDWRWLQRPVGV